MALKMRRAKRRIQETKTCLTEQKESVEGPLKRGQKKGKLSYSQMRRGERTGKESDCPLWCKRDTSEDTGINMTSKETKNEQENLLWASVNIYSCQCSKLKCKAPAYNQVWTKKLARFAGFAGLAFLKTPPDFPSSSWGFLSSSSSCLQGWNNPQDAR